MHTSGYFLLLDLSWEVNALKEIVTVTNWIKQFYSNIEVRLRIKSSPCHSLTHTFFMLDWVYLIENIVLIYFALSFCVLNYIQGNCILLWNVLFSPFALYLNCNIKKNYVAKSVNMSVIQLCWVITCHNKYWWWSLIGILYNWKTAEDNSKT